MTKAATTMASLFLLALSACQTDQLGTGTVYGANYYSSSSGFSDPWYYGGYYNDPNIIVTPPDVPDSSPRPSHPIASPPATGPRPTPMPSIPRAAPRAR